MAFRSSDPRHIDTYEMVFDAAYQGAPGAYSEAAAHVLLGRSARLLPRATIEQVFDALTHGGAAHAVVPVENSLTGTVPNVYELLLSQDVHATREARILIDHALVAPPRTTLADVRRVLSHPIALAQCSNFFRQHRGIQAVPVFDTAGAVEIAMRENEGHTAAIASRRTADVYGAAVLAEHLQDHAENWMRFLLLSPGPAPAIATDAHRALIALSLPHESGALVRMLQPLAEHGLNITKIESRPIPGQSFEYRFIVELTAPGGGAELVAALDRVRETAVWFKLLGSYDEQPHVT